MHKTINTASLPVSADGSDLLFPTCAFTAKAIKVEGRHELNERKTEEAIKKKTDT